MPSLPEVELYEANVNQFALTDLVIGSPIVEAGQDYDLVADEAELPTYLLTVVVKAAGGAGAALTEGIDYSINLITGALVALGGGALEGEPEVWVELTRSGVDDIPHRQLANRCAWLKANVDDLLAADTALAASIAAVASDLSTNYVPKTRTLTAGNGLSGGGDLSANRSLAVQLDGSSLAVSGSGVKLNSVDDTAHGSRGGGSLHANATGAVAGFLSAADKVILDALAAGSAQLTFECINLTTPGSYNDFNPTNWQTCNFVRVVGDGSASDFTFTGFTAPTAGGQRIKFLFKDNSTNCDWGLTFDSASSAAANRVTGPAVGDAGSASKAGVIMAYDITNSIWRVVGCFGSA